MPSFNDQGSTDWRDVIYPPVTISEEESYSSPSSNYYSYSSTTDGNYYMNNLNVGKPSPSPLVDPSQDSNGTSKIEFVNQPTLVSASASQNSTDKDDNSKDTEVRRDSITSSKTESNNGGGQLRFSMPQGFQGTSAGSAPSSICSSLGFISAEIESKQVIRSPVSDPNGRFLTLVRAEGGLFTQAGLETRMPTNPILAGETSPKPATLPMSAIQTFIRIFPVTVQSPTGVPRLSAERFQASHCTSAQEFTSKSIPPPLTTTSMRGGLESINTKPLGFVRADPGSGKGYPSERIVTIASNDGARYAPLVSQQVKVVERINNPLQWSNIATTMNGMVQIVPLNVTSDRDDDSSNSMRPEAKRSTLNEDEEEEHDCGPDSKRMKTEVKPRLSESHEVNSVNSPADLLSYSKIAPPGRTILQVSRNTVSNLVRQEAQNEQYLRMTEFQPISESTALPLISKNPGAVTTISPVLDVKTTVAKNKTTPTDVLNLEKLSTKSSSKQVKNQPPLEFHSQHMSASALIDEIIARGVRETPSQKEMSSRYPITMNDDVIDSGIHKRYEDITASINDECVLRSLDLKTENVQSINSHGFKPQNKRDHLAANDNRIINPPSRFEKSPRVQESLKVQKSVHRSSSLIRSQSMLESSIKLPSSRNESIKFSSTRITSNKRMHSSKPPRLSLDGVVSNPSPAVNGRYLERRSDGDLQSGADSRSRSSGGSSKYMNLRNKSNRRPVEGGGRVRQKRQTARDMVRPLKQWLYAHRDVPYPTRSDKLELAVRSNMSLTQVSNWFANARRRLKNTVQELDSNGQPLSWAKRMKLYNSHVVGNQELLSISSESSCGSSWGDEEDEEEPIQEDDGGLDIEESLKERRPKGSSLLATMDSLNNQGNGSNGGHMAAKFKQGILHRYLNDSYDELMRRHQCHDDVIDDVERRRNASGSLSSHDYEEEVGEEEEHDDVYENGLAPEEDSRSSTHTVTPNAARNADDSLPALLENQQIFRNSTGATQRNQQDDLYWKEISAAMALTTLARARNTV